jgi:hypothetical protein
LRRRGDHIPCRRGAGRRRLPIAGASEDQGQDDKQREGSTYRVHFQYWYRIESFERSVAFVVLCESTSIVYR